MSDENSENVQLTADAFHAVVSALQKIRIASRGPKPATYFHSSQDRKGGIFVFQYVRGNRAQDNLDLLIRMELLNTVMDTEEGELAPLYEELCRQDYGPD